MSNVVPLFKEPTNPPVKGTGRLEDIMNSYVEYAERQGVDIHSQKFLYACATIMTLLQIEIGTK